MNLKIAKWLAAMALAALPWVSAFAQTQTGPALSPSANDVLKLVQSGTTDQVILGYIENSQTPYNLTADAVLYLKDLGVSSQVITAMLNHDKPASVQTYVYNQQLYPPNGNVPPPPAPDQPVGPPPGDVPPPAPIAVPAPAPAPAPTEVSTTAPPEVNYFYNDLSPYGSWVDLEGYGWCWQPTVVVANHNWRPYCDSGHWVYTDSGWFWASDYSWGWAPFHYGRWVMHPRSGWVWFPDTVWGPSWVVWRSSGDSCGWAPLPRGAVYVNGGFRFNGVAVAAGFDFGLSVGVFTFVGTHDFVSHDIVHACYPPARCEQVFHQTTIIHNYTVDNRHIVVNHGIPVDRVSAATHTQIRTVSIHDLPPGSSKPVAQGGTDTVVYRHELDSKPPPKEHVVAQKVNNNNPEIRHGPAMVNSTGHTPATGYKAPTQSQYTPPPSHNQNTYNPPAHQPPPGNSSPTYHPTETTHTTTTTTISASTSQSSTHHTPSQSTPPKQTAPAQASSSSSQQSPHVYYPKGYYQAQSVHMLPPQNANGVIMHPSSSSSSSSGSSSSGGNSNSHGQSSSQGQSQGQSKQGPK